MAVDEQRVRGLAVGTIPTPVTASGTLAVAEPDDLAAIVHDLKNPLAAIALDAQLLGSEPDLDVAAVAASAKRIARNCAFLDRLVHDLLDLCAIDAGKLDLYRTPTELRALVEGVLDRVVSTRDEPRLVAYVSERVTLEIDDLRIERVIANLLQNALKYAPPASAVVVRLEVTAACARLSVIDAGPGIPPEQQAAIFDRYRRGAPSHGGDGHGLGLYVSKRIIEAHRGRIGVESVHGAGSRFFFELPRPA